MIGQALPGELAAQGDAMLWAIAEDFSAIGVNVTTLLDQRLDPPSHMDVHIGRVDEAAALDEAFVRAASAHPSSDWLTASPIFRDLRCTSDIQATVTSPTPSRASSALPRPGSGPDCPPRTSAK